MTEARAARLEKRKKIRKRRLLILLFSFLIIGMAVFAVLLKTKLFPIKKALASGSTVYTSEQIIKAAGITGKTPIFGITESSVAKRIAKKLPYVESLRIKRKFPDTVEIKVSDAKDYYLFLQDVAYYAVSKKGRVLNVYEELPEGVIEVLSESAKLNIGDNVSFADEKEKEIFDYLSSYPEEKGIRLNSVDVTNPLRIVIKVEDRFEVNLGSQANLKEKIDHLSGMIAEIGDRKGRINLDMWSNSDSKGTFIEEN